MSDNLLPTEMVMEILLKLPSKTLVTCTAVCKSWRSIITDPSFISLHHRNSPSFLLLEFCNELTVPNFLHYTLRHDDPSFTHYKTLRLPSLPYRQYSVISLFNGLFCMATGALCQSVIICNPNVRRFVFLPMPRDYSCPYDSCIGFGFDSVNSDYKVLRLSCMMDDDSFGLTAPEVEIYSLVTGGFWRRVRGVVPVCYVEGDSPHCFVNGVVHWAAKRWVDDGWCYFVLSFNFENEMFDEVVLPESLFRGVSANQAGFNVVSGGNGKTLSVYYVNGGDDRRNLRTCEIWVMKEYGVVESWNKIFAFNLRGFCLEFPDFGRKIFGVMAPPSVLCVRNSTEVLLLMEVVRKRRMYSVDLERKRFGDIQIEEEGCTWYLYSGYYSESLLLLNKTGGVWYY